MKKKTKKVTISAICGAIILGGVTLAKAGPTIDNMTTLYNVQKSTYSKTIDEEGNISCDQRKFNPEYLTLEEINEAEMLEIESKSNWEKTETPFWAKEGTHNYTRKIYTAKYSQEEIDNSFLDDLVVAFEQGQINDLTKLSVENYCQEHNLPITEAVSSWDNWEVKGQCNGDNVIDINEKENFTGDIMTVMQVDYDKSITRPATLSEKAMNYMPIALVSVLGAVAGAGMSNAREERKQQIKAKKI